MHATHTILIGAPRDLPGRGAKPAILQRSDEDFLPATLDDLRSAAGRGRLQALAAKARDSKGQLKLFQPIQRQFHIALTEAWCDTPGTPRVDPARVAGAGMVVRRLDAQGRAEGWMRSKGRVRGWLPLSRVGGPDRDPVAAQRLQLGLSGVADIDRQLAGIARLNDDSLLEEHVIAMYLAPPDVCGDAGKTLFYGIVPTISSELSEADAVFEAAPGVDFGPQSDAFRKHLVLALNGEAMALPFTGQPLSPGWFALSQAAGADATLARFVLLLRQLGTEFNLFDGGSEVAALKQALHGIALPLVRRGSEAQRHVQADDFLARAHAIVLQGGSVPGGAEMPSTWPALPAPVAAALRSALHAAMVARFAAMKGKQGRFDEPAARYVLRAFVRLKADGPCPSRIVWGEASEPFTIAPWYEGAGAAPVQIPLPDPGDKNLMNALKPNVAFVVPPSLQSLLGGATKDILDGKGTSSGLGLTWICGFNIPIITICAFLVLNIFLTLFNLVFGWLFFMKICLPFPKIPPK
ncbi:MULTISPECIES: hypothetical protein [unclassified Rhizobacter]|uniref:hypothetical protein n=1 Tax=unclassified Rhizobacter TaxID=2640088 RepID=UPI0006FA7D10|nr:MULTISPECIES: hypothetical protein [unclassified Rhizobacter]KQU77103.1 hypothetical protein ASC88_23390 [Rhizobacter sp. Root29]KQW14228.1 hypothetical protein ASC98_16430 [Rhizobacter sp. Root1238]KRB19083.1 hypothetical protein ASE08_04970 [Rhizobacter sp. Root16D2]